MNKQFAALFLAGAAVSAGAHAQTNVSMYGLVDAYVGGVRNSVGTNAAGANRGTAVVVNPSGMTTSFLGFKGSEDLGGGLKAIFAIEAFFRNDTGAFGRFGSTQDLGFTRNAFVGLAGDFGQVTVGRNTAPYFLSTILFNPFVDSFALSPAVAHVFRGDNNSQGIVQGDTGLSNSIRYTTPTFGGLRGDFAYAANTNGVLVQEDLNNRSLGRAFDAALFFARGPLGATAVYRTINLRDGSATGRRQQAGLLGLSYDLKFAKLFGQYQQTRDNFVAAASSADPRKNTYQAGVSVPLGQGAVLASYAHSKLDRVAAETKRNTWALGYDYSFSKRTDAYLVYYRDRMEDVLDNTQSVLALGVRHRF